MVSDVPAHHPSRRCPMPWYWTDDVAEVMMSKGRLSACEASSLISRPVGIRSSCQTIEEAIEGFLEDGEIPLAA